MYKINGVKFEIGDYIWIAKYDTIVDDSLWSHMMDNTEDKGEYFELSLMQTRFDEENDCNCGYIVYAHLNKEDLMAHNGYKEIKESNPDLTDWEVLDEFVEKWKYCSTFLEMYVEIVKVETW